MSVLVDQLIAIAAEAVARGFAQWAGRQHVGLPSA